MSPTRVPRTRADVAGEVGRIGLRAEVHLRDGRVLEIKQQIAVELVETTVRPDILWKHLADAIGMQVAHALDPQAEIQPWPT